VGIREWGQVFAFQVLRDGELRSRVNGDRASIFASLRRSEADVNLLPVADRELRR
jgi:hypothetical protein